MSKNYMQLKIPTQFPVTAHTDHVGKASTFVAIKGLKDDGIGYITQAVEKGASTVVVQEDATIPQATEHLLQQRNVSLKRVPNSRQALAQLSAQASGYPAQKLKIIGITGTKGKTTTSFILEHLLRSAGYATALLSTVRNRIKNHEFTTALTTQQPDYLHVFLDLCVKEGVTHVVMEVSAQALTLHRLEGIEFDGIIFTNFSQEHAEFYTSQGDYFAAKKLIFSAAKPSAPVFINADDEHGKKLLQDEKAYLSFGVQNDALARALAHNKVTQYGIGFAIYFKEEIIPSLHSSLIGSYNVYNILGAVAMARSLGVSLEIIKQSVATFTHVPGRMERYQIADGITCVIDYAHTPSAFQAVLGTLRPMTDSLIVVFGCGGDRDSIKRPEMGRIASELGDKIFITSDNPRSEDVNLIIESIVSGVSDENRAKVVCESDREQAIKKAYDTARPGSIVALLGKGPDEYEEVKGKKRYFSEKQIILGLGK